MTMTGTLTLICRKCCMGGTFQAANAAEAAKTAIAQGWKMPHEREFVCPRCVKKGRA